MGKRWGDITMKKILGLWMLFYLSTAAAEQSVLEHVQSLYTIQDDCLINVEGNVFEKIPFKSSLHEQLSYKLKDADWADVIYMAYETHIASFLTDVESFERALLKICQQLGTPYGEKALLKALDEEHFVLHRSLKIGVQNFLKAFSIPSLEYSEKKRPLKIAIITTTSTGGNLSVAQAVRGYLDLFPDLYEAVMIDYETFAETFDPIKIATGKYTTDGVFRLMQQYNDVDARLLEQSLMCQEVAKYIPHQTGAALKKKLREFQPDLIISTRNYYPDDFNLLSLNIPFRMLYCDHDLCLFHQEYLGKIDSERVKFWLPSFSPRFFKTFFESMEKRNFKGDWTATIHRIAELTRSSFDEIDKTFEVIGYPVRLEFQKIEDLEQIKNKWDLSTEEKGILIEMGANGVGILEHIFHLLKNEPSDGIPKKYFFICGRNEGLKSKLQLENFLPRHAILGYLSASEKNELMHICSLMLSKPGGATVAELIKVQLPMLIMHIQKFCEEGNKQRLFEAGLAYVYDPDQPLSKQIERILEKSPCVSEEGYLDWQEKLSEKLKVFMRVTIEQKNCEKERIACNLTN